MKQLLFASLVVLLASCNNDPILYTFEGQITENITGGPLAGATVSISQKPFSNSVSSNSFDLVGSTVTDANGNYTVIFERKKVTEFRVSVEKDGYFPQDIILGSAEVSSENNNVVGTGMDAQSWVNFDIQNVLPSDAADNYQLIFYTYRTGCAGCIEEDYNYLPGVVDSNLIFLNTGGQYLKFIKVDVGIGQSVTDSLWMTPFDTVNYSIIY